MLARCARERPSGMQWAGSARQAPPPHGPGRRGERVHCGLLSCVSQSRVQGRGWPEPDLLPGPAAVPAGPTLSASASARGWSPGSGTPESPASSAPSRERASGQAFRGGPASSPLRPAPTHLQQPALLLLALQLLPDVRQLPPADRRSRGRGGLGRLRATGPPPCPRSFLLPTYSSCTPIRSSDLLKDSISSCSLIISPLSLLLSVRFCGTRESGVGVSWGSGVDLIE